MSLKQVASVLVCFHVRPLLAAEDAFPAACPDGICPGLGHTFYLPDPDVISTEGRVFVLNAKLGVCAGTSAQERSTRALKTADSMQELVMDTNTDFGISGSYKSATLTVKGEVEVKTSTSSDITSSFHATHLDVTSIKREVYLEQSTKCLGEESGFDPAFLDRFKALPGIDAERVAESTSWAPYVNFLKDQGSHIMVRQSIGSRFQKWESSTSSSSKTAETLKVKACASVEGVDGPAGWSVQSCGAYNESEKRTALKAESHEHMVILGGTTATRTAILNNLNEQTLSDFISSAPDGDLAVSYGFKPIWETLITFYMERCSRKGASSEDCRHQQRAYNLQAAYEGWLATGCPKLTTTNGYVYQAMAIADPSAAIKTYQCDAGRTGCRTDNDCHIGGAGSVCYCHGTSCLEKGDAVEGTSMFRSKVQGSKSGSTWNGANLACYYHIGIYCKCDKSWAGGLRERQLYVQNGFMYMGRHSAPSNMTLV